MMTNARRTAWRLLALLSLPVFSWAATIWAQELAPSAGSVPTDWISDFIARHGLLAGLVAVFLGGLALNLTPCVYPMIPVTVAFFTSQAALTGRLRGGSLGRAIALAGCYVLGLSVMYAFLGILAASTGAMVGSWLQRPAVLLGVALVVIWLAMSMFGLYDLRAPQALTRRVSRASSGLLGAFLMGLVVGVVATPCIGPFVLGLLLLISRLGNPVIGFLLLFVLGLGMGLPYLVLAVASNRVGQLPKAGPWLVWAKKVFGVVLLGLALYFIKPLIPVRVMGALVAGLLIGAGGYLGWWERTTSRTPWFVWIRRLVGAALLVSAAAVMWPRPQATAAVRWVPYSEAAFAQAVRERRPILIDIYADWCLPCVELDQVTFRRPQVVQALAEIATLRVDATRDIPEQAMALVERHRVYGVPTILLFDRNGTERTDLRLLGFEPPDEFLKRLAQLR